MFFLFLKLYLKKQTHKMYKFLIAPILVSSLLFGACHKKASTNSSAVGAKKEEKKEQIKNAIVTPEIDLTNTGNAYVIDSLALSGDILSIFVNYSGGCKEHSFDLYSNGMFAKSLPPQLSLCLKHTGNDDACRELIMKELKFNVSTLRYSGKNTVVLKFKDKRVTYNY